MGYLWTNQSTIQSYLDGEGSIQIRSDDDPVDGDPVENFTRAASERLENESVYEVATLLSLAYIVDPDFVPEVALPDDTDVGVYSDLPFGFKPIDDTTSPGTACPNYLSLLVGKLTAAKIASLRLGASLSRFPNWVRAYKNEVYAQIQRWMINAETATMKGLKLRADFNLADVLLKVKTREHTAEEIED